MRFYRLTTADEVSRLASRLPDIVAVDTEYSEKDVRKAQLLSVVVADGEEAYSFPPEFLPQITDSLQSRKAVFMQHATVDLTILIRYGCDLRNTTILDTITLHHLLDENSDHDLGSMVLKYFNDNYKSEFWEKYKTYQDAPEEEQLAYECKDGVYTYRLGMQFLDELRGRDALVDHTHRLFKALYETELAGVRVNVELMRETREKMLVEIEGYLPKLREEFSDWVLLWEMQKWSEEIGKRKTDKGKLSVKRPEFNFASDTQLSWLIYDALCLPVLEKTKKGNPSTSYETLEALAKENPVLETLVKYKGAKTLFSTFVEGMLERVSDNRIYPKFNVNGTTTGRISHSNPNLGNLPKDGPIRGFFIPDNGFSIIGADYSQLEVIVEANLTEDAQLLKIILEGASKHDITAQGLGLDRNTAKTLNFALQYGAGVHKVSKLLNVSYKSAQEIFDQYWRLYSGVKALKDETERELKANGYVTNIFGRARHFDTPKTEFEAARASRQAYNFKVQGPAGDICNRAFYLYSERLKSSQRGTTLWSVHDEIVAQVKDEFSESEKSNLTDIMVNVTEYVGFKYPLQAVAYGPLKAWAKA